MNIITTTNTFDNNETEVKGKVIRKAQIARQLLHRGQQIIDIKGDKGDPDGKRSVFVFKDSDEFQRVFSELLEENKKYREKSETDNLKKQIEELNKKLSELSEAKEKE